MKPLCWAGMSRTILSKSLVMNTIIYIGEIIMETINYRTTLKMSLQILPSSLSPLPQMAKVYSQLFPQISPRNSIIHRLTRLARKFPNRTIFSGSSRLRKKKFVGSFHFKPTSTWIVLPKPSRKSFCYTEFLNQQSQ
ncbi:BA75_01186T0 [Komagataella pastoris]|uniref:BA75_01186T0 n=1 Tax=Komagataella pastoris TaxID=4922 RepID=A0A1B2JAE8_PICPA|nr:BA75_01186T0 [Komagataella pastoris]